MKHDFDVLCHWHQVQLKNRISNWKRTGGRGEKGTGGKGRCDGGSQLELAGVCVCVDWIFMG